MKCHKDRPEDPITFIKENVAVTLKKKLIIEEWKQKIEEVKNEVADMESQLAKEKLKLTSVPNKTNSNTTKF